MEKTVYDSINMLKEIKNSGKTNNFKEMIIFYENPPKAANAIISKESEWLHCLILKGNDDKIVKVFEKFLEGDLDI